jgi:HrpA-like RNA helicase
MEINRCIDTIRSEVTGFSLELFPLHAQLSNKDQSAVFRRPRKGSRKVVAATNIAETSITIDDVVFVIDSGRVKEMRLEHSTLCLVETLASKASCKQRRGRAGRVRPGTCYKLYSRFLENKYMPSHAVPEIQRVPLEQLCLTLKAMNIQNSHDFLMKV